MDILSNADKKQQERIKALTEVENKVKEMAGDTLSTDLLQAVMYQYLYHSGMNLSKAHTIIRKQQ
jgi:hypothetical protein